MRLHGTEVSYTTTHSFKLFFMAPWNFFPKRSRQYALVEEVDYEDESKLIQKYDDGDLSCPPSPVYGPQRQNPSPLSAVVSVFNLLFFALSLWLFVMAMTSKAWDPVGHERNYFIKKTSEPCKDVAGWQWLG
jgi:hypothetical protein